MRREEAIYIGKAIKKIALKPSGKIAHLFVNRRNSFYRRRRTMIKNHRKSSFLPFYLNPIPDRVRLIVHS